VKDDLLVSLGMIVWKGRELYAAGEINKEELFDLVSKGFGRQAFKLGYYSQVESIISPL
jgi:hypothetical protein